MPRGCRLSPFTNQETVPPRRSGMLGANVGRGTGDRRVVGTGVVGMGAAGLGRGRVVDRAAGALVPANARAEPVVVEPGAEPSGWLRFVGDSLGTRLRVRLGFAGGDPLLDGAPILAAAFFFGAAFLASALAAFVAADFSFAAARRSEKDLRLSGGCGVEGATAPPFRFRQDGCGRFPFAGTGGRRRQSRRSGVP